MSEQQDLKQEQIDQLSINRTLRFLAVDAVEKAKSGHPGAPLGCAPIAYLLYHTDHEARSVGSEVELTAIVRAVERPTRRRSLYGALHLSGLPTCRCRSWSSSGSGDRTTPGHPEYGGGAWG